MGMVSGVLVLMGFATVGVFMIFGPLLLLFFFKSFFDIFLNRFPTASQPFSIVPDRFTDGRKTGQKPKLENKKLWSDLVVQSSR